MCAPPCEFCSAADLLSDGFNCGTCGHVVSLHALPGPGVSVRLKLLHTYVANQILFLSSALCLISRAQSPTATTENALQHVERKKSSVTAPVP